MKKLYLVALGVTEINGEPVPKNRRISITKEAALYDLAHGRLTPVLVRKKKAADHERR